MVQLSGELLNGLDHLVFGTKMPQWQLDDLKGAWNNTKALGSTLHTIGMAAAAEKYPGLLVNRKYREAQAKTFEMGSKFVGDIWNNIKTGNSYAIGGYIFDVASMFVGVGEVSAALKGTNFATKLAKGANAFKAATKAKTAGKLASVFDKTMKYGDDVARAFGKGTLEPALAGGVISRYGDDIGRYADDVGKINSSKFSNGLDDLIVDGSHLDGGKLKPNIKYKSGENGYSYKTDGTGRISDATTNDLKLKIHEGRLPHKSKTPDKLAGDHAGHLFGDRFGGSPELDNLVSQASKVNLSEYKKLENTWANALEQGKKVTVDIRINYPSGSSRSSSFEVKYTIDGIPSFKKINN